MTASRNRACLKRALFSVFAGWCGTIAVAGAAATIWECTDPGENKYFTNIDPSKPHYLCTSPDNPKLRVISPEGGPGCQYLASQPPGACRALAIPVQSSAPAAAADTPQSDATADFRKRLKIGDRTSAGLVIDIKPPIARIQTATTERWFRIDELQPARR